jgi:hypothetical protein
MPTTSSRLGRPGRPHDADIRRAKSTQDFLWVFAIDAWAGRERMVGYREKGSWMSAANVASTPQQLEAIAWDFLGSEFTEQNYAVWSIDRRVDAYLHHQGLDDIVNDGAAYNALLERVMANIPGALRQGVLAEPHI